MAVNPLIKHKLDGDKMKASALAALIGNTLINEDFPVILERMCASIEGGECNIYITRDGYLDVMTIVPGKATYLNVIIEAMINTKFWSEKLTGKTFRTASKSVCDADIVSAEFNIRDLNLHLSMYPNLAKELVEKEKVGEEVVSEYTVYEHHGVMMHTRHAMKGLHRDNCLCYECERFAPNTLNNCMKSQAIYENCVAFDVVTPVWECADFRENGSTLTEALEAVDLAIDAIELERAA
jgi:hypothetical protein